MYAIPFCEKIKGKKEHLSTAYPYTCLGIVERRSLFLNFYR